MRLNFKKLSLPILIFSAIAFYFLFEPNVAQAATLSLEPATADIKAGKDLVVQIMLETDNTEDLLDGADALLKFDSYKLKPKDVEGGEAFKNVVNKEGDGQLQITGFASPEGAKFADKVSIATVTFQILESGKTTVDIDYTEGLTTDSNVTAHKSAKDLLTEVSGGEYQVTATPVQQTISLFRRLLPFLAIGIVLLLIGLGIYYWWRNRSPGVGEGIFVPEEVPLDRVPTEADEPKPSAAPVPKIPAPSGVGEGN